VQVGLDGSFGGEAKFSAVLFNANTAKVSDPPHTQISKARQCRGG